MFISIQTICTCHGYLLFESLHCERCRSLIPFQLSDESLLDPVPTHNIKNGIQFDKKGRPPPGMLVPYHKQQEQTTTTGRVRLRALCPFCNSSTFIIRYYCKRERLYYHLRIQNCGENEQIFHRSIAETQNMISIDQFGVKRDQSEGSVTETNEDSYSISGSISQQTPSTIPYDPNGSYPNPRDAIIENERTLNGLKDIEGDLFAVLRNGLFYDTLIQCQDDVKLQVHRCILGGRSSWFRHLIGEYHESNTNDDYVLQISIDDIQSDVMNEILNYMYTNRCMISLKNAPDLLIAAKRFELDKLTKQIADFLLHRLTIDNAIEMLICAHESNSEALKLACIRLINRHAEQIKRTEKWKTFKTQYIDLIPELYENRIEHPTSGQQPYIPDVFNQAEFPPSETLRSLSQLYENPIQQRIQTPNNRILPTTNRSQQNVLKSIQLADPNEYSLDKPGGFYTSQRADSNLSISTNDRDSPIKQRMTNNNTRRSMPPIIRTVLPNIRQNADTNIPRRPVNLYEASQTLPVNNNQRSTYTRIPTPPSIRDVTPKHTMRYPPGSKNHPDDHMTLTRVVSIEPSD